MNKALSGENNPMFGKFHLINTLNKLSQTNGTIIYVYSLNKTTLVNTFPSVFKAGKIFNVTHLTIMKYAKKDIIF